MSCLLIIYEWYTSRENLYVFSFFKYQSSRIHICLYNFSFYVLSCVNQWVLHHVYDLLYLLDNFLRNSRPLQTYPVHLLSTPVHQLRFFIRSDTLFKPFLNLPSYSSHNFRELPPRTDSTFISLRENLCFSFRRTENSVSSGEIYH